MEGANPLEQLRGIHIPDGVSAWPPAIGWWLVMIASLAMIIGVIWLIQQGRWKRKAIQTLKTIETRTDSGYYTQVNRLLKQVAIHRFGQQCASLSGAKWLNFLDSKLKSPVFEKHIPEFAEAPDNPNCQPDPHLVMRYTQHWIGRHKC